MIRDRSFLTRVRGRLADLHPAERRVGELVCDFPGEVASYSAKELAALAGVSNATVTRFVRRLGYDSYEEARRHARQESETGSRLYAVNLDKWNALSADDRQALESGIAAFVDDVWAFSEELYEDAMRCNTGQQPCDRGTAYALKEVPVSEADLELVKQALTETSLPVWAQQCNAVNPGCEAEWRATIGNILGL